LQGGREVPEDLRDYFLKLEGIPGECEDKVHPDEIRLSDFAFAMKNRNRAGYAAGKTVFEDVSFSGPIDVSYPKIQDALANNQPIKKATLCCRKAGKSQMDFLTITFTDLYVSHCRLESEGSLLNMFITMNFAKTQIEYREQTDKGTLGGAMSAMFDVRVLVR
jgi:type VI secretion system secreted protein Hcp